MLRQRIHWLLGALWIVLASALGQAAEPPGLEIGDYFRLQRITEVAMSSDGRRLAFVAEGREADAEGAPRRLHLRSLAPGGETRIVNDLADARSLAWIAGTSRLAFLRPSGGALQLFTWDASSGDVAQLTHGSDSVSSFAFAPNGMSLAYTTRGAPAPGESLYDRFRNAGAGILVDPATTSSHDFLNPGWNALVRPPPPRLWIVVGGGPAVEVPVPGKPAGRSGTYHWSSDGRALSVVFVHSGMAESQLSDERTSLGVYELESGRFDTLAQASPPATGRPGLAYLGGEWVPGARRLLIRRVTEADPWVSGSHPDWAVIDAGVGLTAAAWRAVELYPSRLRLMPLSDTEIWLENTSRGLHSLFVLTPDGVRPSPIVAGVEGSAGLFAFSADRNRVAFVRESLTRPPELFVRIGQGPARQITRLNEMIAARVRHRAREIRWAGRDGVELSGWLLEPSSASRGPLPLVTHVHGGPAFPFPNAFAPYFDYWPYALEIYAARGLAVFLPNYRGTHSYGRNVATPGRREDPVDDIIAGIEHLVRTGLADPARLGISGHSHGAVVGPMAMARARNFRASSFAEGVGNAVVMYELMSADANREIHDSIFGASLYDAPELYLAESPSLHFRGVTTPSLFEGGAFATSLYMLGYAKAAHRFGMPTEFVIYPKTGHNIALPALQRESAARNLDWFEFWLLGREDSAPDKAEQYLRWRRLRETIARLDTSSPATSASDP